MPFTLAHPAVVLPIRQSNYWHKPALILGSMSPDFVYFLQGQASSNSGHTWWGFLLINLPLCALLYWLYQRFISPYFWRYLPNFLQISILANPKPVTVFNALIFISSAIFGMMTHVLLDSFTHPTGWFVENFTLFQQTFFGLAVYKWLQYLGGIIGLAVIAGYWLYLAKLNVRKANVEQKAKWCYWLAVLILAVLFLLIWQILQPIGLDLLVNWVIRCIDGGLLAVVLVGVWLNHKKT